MQLLKLKLTLADNGSLKVEIKCDPCIEDYFKRKASTKTGKKFNDALRYWHSNEDYMLENINAALYGYGNFLTDPWNYGPQMLKTVGITDGVALEIPNVGMITQKHLTKMANGITTAVNALYSACILKPGLEAIVEVKMDQPIDPLPVPEEDELIPDAPVP